MTGDLQISKKAKPAVKLIDVSTSGETDNTGEFLLRSSLGVCLSHYNKETDKTAELRVSADSINPIKVEVEGVAYNLFGEHNTDLLKNHVLPLDGSVSMGGNLIVEKEGWIGVKLRNPSTGREGRLAHSSNQNLVQFANYKDDNNLSVVALNNESNALNTMLQLSVKKEGNSVSYNIFGEHNKPTGFYSGNGSAEQRTIPIGGVGSILWIKSAKYLTFVWNFGGFTLDGVNGSVKFHPSSQLDFEDGVLTIASTHSAINDSTNVHYYGYVG
jgi:hypothetical protein